MPGKQQRARQDPPRSGDDHPASSGTRRWRGSPLTPMADALLAEMVRQGRQDIALEQIVTGEICDRAPARAVAVQAPRSAGYLDSN